jgi:hypothetical protein
MLLLSLIMTALMLAACVVADDGPSPGGTCIERASKPLGAGAVGGWTSIDASNGANSDVNCIVAAAVERLNNNSNDAMKYAEGLANGVTVAYKQIVNGINYCIRFSVDVVGCKDGSNNCNSSNYNARICDSYAYRAFNWQNPRLGRLDGVVCG